jgi:hypothetical protein
MMACCLLAALILAHIVAMVRRWGIFWGVVSPREWENPETVFNRIAAWLGRPKVTRAVFALAAAELAVLGGWVYAAHGTHLYQLGDQTLGKLRGEQIVYAEICTPGGTDRAVRIVVNRAAPAEKLASAT